MKNLWDPSNMDVLHHVNQGLRAHTLFHRDVDYVVKDGQVTIVDEFTGRLMPGRRWSDGLHQAVEAKEKVKIERENQTLATITFQNYFRMYGKLSGMTGTAETEAAEFDKIYKLEVLVIPTNRPLIRVENPDVVYRTEPEKFGAVVKEIQDLHESGRPVLVGTISIEKSEQLSTLLKKAGHQARGAEREVPRARGRDRGAGGPLRRGDDRDQHGRPRHRHHPRRRARPPRQGGAGRAPRREEARPRATPPPRTSRPCTTQVTAEMASEFKRELQQRKPNAETRKELARRYLGLMASFAPDHPSVLAVRGLAPEGSRLAAYLDAGRDLPRLTKEKIAKSFYPEIENPVDFLAVHPLKASIEALVGDARVRAASSSCSTPTSASGWWRSAACTSSAPSATRRAASTTSCAAAPAARATRARRASTCRCRTT